MRASRQVPPADIGAARRRGDARAPRKSGKEPQAGHWGEAPNATASPVGRDPRLEHDMAERTLSPFSALVVVPIVLPSVDQTWRARLFAEVSGLARFAVARLEPTRKLASCIVGRRVELWRRSAQVAGTRTRVGNTRWRGLVKLVSAPPSPPSCPAGAHGRHTCWSLDRLASSAIQWICLWVRHCDYARTAESKMPPGCSVRYADCGHCVSLWAHRRGPRVIIGRCQRGSGHQRHRFCPHAIIACLSVACLFLLGRSSFLLVYRNKSA